MKMGESKKYKTFLEIGDQMRKKRSNELVHYLNGYVEKECPEITVNRLLGFLCIMKMLNSTKD